MKRIKLLLLLLNISYISVFSENIIISGKIINSKTKQPIEFASISIKGTTIGTITNSDGEFEILIPEQFKNRQISVSYIGYKTYSTPILKITNNFLNVELENIGITIDEVVVITDSPQELIRKAIRKIPDNYSDKAIIYTCFFRETVKENERPVEMVEAVLDIYNYSYADPNLKEKEKIRLVKGRELESFEPAVFKNIVISGGVKAGATNDMIHYPGTFLQEKYFDSYEYHYKGSTEHNNRRVYVIAFDQMEEIKKAYFKGNIYIDVESLAFVKVEYAYSEKGIMYYRPSLVTQGIMTFMGLNLEIKELSANVNYNLIGDKWYLKNINVHGALSLSKERKGEFADYEYNLNLLVTDIEIENVKEFTDEELINSKKRIADQVKEYEKNYWDEYNTLKSSTRDKKAIKDILRIKKEVRDTI